MPKKKRDAIIAIEFRLENLKTMLSIYEVTDNLKSRIKETEAVIDELESLIEYLKE